MKRLFMKMISVAAVASAVVLTGCMKEYREGTTMKIDDSSDREVTVGDTVFLKAIISPADESSSVVWATTDENVAKVVVQRLVEGMADRYVMVLANAPGEAKVYVTVNGTMSDTCKITVNGTPTDPAKVTLSDKELIIGKGYSDTLTYKVEPEGANVTSVKWSVEDGSVAAFSQDGVIVGLKGGMTWVYVDITSKIETSTVKSEVTVKDSCLVCVSPFSANCYIASKPGTYRFKAVKGNSNESVGEVKSVEVLWEAFGTDKAPNKGDIISGVKYENGMVTYTVTDKKGNAVIAARDGDGKILWSWHIWCTDQPEEQVYNNNAGTMMDRNLGATCANPKTPADSVAALGLLYQWGRKDPFLGSSSISKSTKAASTLTTWPTPVDAQNNASDATLNLRTSIAYPTTFIKTSNDPGSTCDWYCTIDAQQYRNDTLWKTSAGKTIYDPCPVGWRVPDGGKMTDGGVWAKAFNYEANFSESPFAMGYDFAKTNKKLMDGGVCWYPAAGGLAFNKGSVSGVGMYGYYMSSTPENGDNWVYNLYFYIDASSIRPLATSARGNGKSVRCMKDVE